MVGRKPLIFVRAPILGMLMPSSGDPKRVRGILLKIFTMNDEGPGEPCKPAVQRKTSRAAFDRLPYAERIAALGNTVGMNEWSLVSRICG